MLHCCIVIHRCMMYSHDKYSTYFYLLINVAAWQMITFYTVTVWFQLLPKTFEKKYAFRFMVRDVKKKDKLRFMFWTWNIDNSLILAAHWWHLWSTSSSLGSTSTNWPHPRSREPVLKLHCRPWWEQWTWFSFLSSEGKDSTANQQRATSRSSVSATSLCIISLFSKTVFIA